MRNKIARIRFEMGILREARTFVVRKLFPNCRLFIR